MKKAMKTTLCGVGLVFLLAGVPVRAAVDGTVTFNAGAHLQVNDFNYLVNGNYETFLDATDSVGTFATSNLEKPYG